MLALVTVSVFGLFHPTEFEVRPAHGGAIVVEHDGRQESLEGAHALLIRTAARVTGRNGAPAEFVLSVPGRVHREFHGRLEVRPDHAHLLAIVEMDRETAVRSIVAAELPTIGAEAGFEALKAQAVASRSFLAASRGRHEDFEFCDTTHCQFLREPPSPKSLAARAAEETRGLALAYQGQVLAALYSADCGGRTRTLEQAGWQNPNAGPNTGDYPYFAVECPRRGATSSGHQVGLCQAGAAEMARRGATFHEILGHFYPATVLVNLEQIRE
jgi:stage II sporulation protein D